MVLSSLNVDDIDERYVEWLADSDVNQYLETRHKKWGVAEIKDFVSDQNKSEDQYLLGIFVDNKHIGNIKIGPINIIHSVGTISLFIGDKEYWGKGIATESIKMITRFAVDNLRLRKLVAGMYSSNLGSLKAFLNAGFSFEGVLKSQYVSNQGVRIDLLQVGLVC